MSYIFSILWLLVALVAQVLVFNHLSLWGGVALVYLYVLAKLPVEMNRSLQVVVGFVTGLVIDIFCNTPGMHTLAATTTMWLRIPIFRMYVNGEDFKEGVPSLWRLTFVVFTKYFLSVVLLHVVLLYLVESFSLFLFLSLIAKIIVSLILTYVFALVIEAYRRN